MNVVDRLGREFAAVAAAAGEEVVVEAIDVFDAHAAQVNVADARVDVVGDHPLVTVCGRGAQLRASTRHPLFGEESSDCQCASRRVWRLGRGGVECRSNRLGVGP